MGMVEGLIEGLGKTPAVQEAMGKLEELRSGVISAMTHFDAKLTTMDAKMDRILLAIEHPSDVAPAGDDGLMKLLAEDGQEMIMQKPEPMAQQNEQNLG